MDKNSPTTIQVEQSITQNNGGGGSSLRRKLMLVFGVIFLMLFGVYFGSIFLFPSDKQKHSQGTIVEIIGIGQSIKGNNGKDGEGATNQSIESKLPVRISLKTRSKNFNTKISKCTYSQGWYGVSGVGINVDWGDGSRSPKNNYEKEELGKSCSLDLVNHTYMKAGTYRISLESWSPGPTDRAEYDERGVVYLTIKEL